MTTPGGLLAWGQAGNYDAIEDRMVVTALAGRAGLVAAPALAARGGLTVGVGPWLGIVDCGDRTLAVVGAREEQQQDVPAGGAQPRTDVLWADIDTDAGTWQGRLYPAGGEAGRLGVLLATIVVPAGANSAAQMELIPGPTGGGAGGGLLAMAVRNAGGLQNANTWETALGFASCPTEPVMLQPGRWYRVRFSSTSVTAESGSSLEGRIGVGSRPEGQPQSAAILGRAAIISYRRLQAGQGASVEWIFQRPGNVPPGRYIFEGRIWAHISGQYRMGTAVGHGDYVCCTIEDLGGGT
jgi:hypothetical protein